MLPPRVSVDRHEVGEGEVQLSRGDVREGRPGQVTGQAPGVDTLWGGH